MKETGEGWKPLADTEHSGLVSYWADEPASVVPVRLDRLSALAESSAAINEVFEPNRRIRRGLIRSVGAVVLRIVGTLYRWAWPWR